ncbi:hypothetical protein CU012_1799 [Enterococcus faecium]|nr:hypothetical protein [Enterococcus faecium]
MHAENTDLLHLRMLLLVCFQVLDAALFQQQKHHQIRFPFE